jgi:hypothetical protein
LITFFILPLNPDAHPTSRFLKIMHHNPTTPTIDHKNKWKSDGFMDIYYVVGVISIPYPRFGMIINIVSKDDNFYHATCLNFIKLSSMTLGKKRKWELWERSYVGIKMNVSMWTYDLTYHLMVEVENHYCIWL